MSYGPPPGPSEPAGPPPPGGNYGPASSYGSPPSTGSTFDPKSVDPLDWVAVAAGVLALIFSFFAFYTYTAKGTTKSQGCSRLSEIPASVRGTIGALCDGDSYSAWNGFFGWFGVLLAVIGAVLIAVAVFAPRLSVPFPLRLAAGAAYALGFVFVLLALFVVPRWPAGAVFGISDSDYNKGIDEGHGFAYWIVLALTLIGAVVAFLRFQQTGGMLPGRGTAAATTPGQPAEPGYGAPGGYAPPQGAPPQQYGEPPQQYGEPPQGPPAGYQQGPPQGPPPGYQQQPPPGYQQPPPGYQQPPPGYQQQPPQEPPPGYNPQ